MVANGFGVLLLDLLGQKADLSAVFAIIAVAIDRLAIVGLTDGPDVLLQAFVGAEAAGGGAGRGRARKRARALRDVRQELGDLERIALLLQELIIHGGLASLLRLLLDLTGGKLRLSAGKARSLQPLPKGGKLLGRLSASVIDALTNVLEARRGRRALSKSLLRQRGLLLRRGGSLVENLTRALKLALGKAHALLVLLLAKGRLLLGRRQGLTKLLLAEGRLLTSGGRPLVEELVTSAHALLILLLTKGRDVLTRRLALTENLLAKSAEPLPHGRALTEKLLPESGLLFGGAHALLVLLAAQRRKVLPRTSGLPIKLLPEGRLLLGCRQVLAKLLLSKRS